MHDPESPYKGMYDEEVVLTLSDWYHGQMPSLLLDFISVTNPTGAEPVPDAALMNDSQNVTFSVQPGETYFFRVINMGAFAAQYFWFEGHQMQIVEVDGVYTQQSEADMIYITPAQRYGLLVTAKNDTNANFPIVGSMDQDLFDAIPPTLNPNVTGWLVYDRTKPSPDPATVDDFDAAFDDFTLVPYDQQELFDHVDQTVTLEMKMDNLGDGANYAFFNDVSYVTPKVPSLYSAMSTGSSATVATIYGPNTNAFVLGHNQVVELVLNSNDDGTHPFHLHGRNFQAVARSDTDAGAWADNATLPRVPMRRDTFFVNGNGHIVLRFRSDNPGMNSLL